MSDRVVVFYDYQNTYMGARRLYHDHWEGSNCGQFDPVALAQHLAADSPYQRHLHQVRIYRGQPDATRQPGSYAASRRQHAAWQREPLVHLSTRPLRYPQGWPRERPQEKGIDVQLTMDFAIMASRNEFDVGIMMSTDTDLKPALEYVYDITGGTNTPRAEVAAWSCTGQHSRRLSLTGGRRLYCHWVQEDVYKRVQDTTDYTIGN
ncbi:NYN domain-containing protein [Streptomyces acidiscabies]|uniref:NYN domain-containing protein n=1 Tax=Streptomyces acidiscabies TaxID=42234 RepID=UPI00096455FA|nr:NYN domain-containing protein [Streptomyces acidiscabies]GAV38266.1 NYN domain protein [Streptomyces acidiscabies]